MKVKTGIALGATLAAIGGIECAPQPINATTGPDNSGIHNPVTTPLPPRTPDANGFTPVPVQTLTPEGKQQTTDVLVNFGTADKDQATKTLAALKARYPGTATLKSVRFLGNTGSLAEINPDASSHTAGSIVIRPKDTNTIISPLDIAATFGAKDGSVTGNLITPVGNVSTKFANESDLQLAQQVANGLYKKGNVYIEPLSADGKDLLVYAQYQASDPNKLGSASIRQALAVIDAQTGKLVNVKKTSDISPNGTAIAWLESDQPLAVNLPPVEIDVVQIGDAVFLVDANSTQHLLPPTSELNATLFSVSNEAGGITKYIVLSDAKGSQIATADSATGALTWDAKNWSTLKDSDKTQIVAWLAGQKINRIEINQTDGAKLMELPNGKSFLPVKIASDAQFALVHDSKKGVDVAQINGRAFATWENSSWVVGGQYVAPEISLVTNLFPDFAIAPLPKGSVISYSLINANGVEIGSFLDRSAPNSVKNINWDKLSSADQTKLASALLDRITFQGFSDNEVKDLKTRTLFWLSKFPNQLPSADTLGISGFVLADEYKAFSSRNKLLSVLLYLKLVSVSNNNTNYGGSGSIWLVRYPTDNMVGWLYKETMNMEVAAEKNLTGNAVGSTNIGGVENNATAVVAAVFTQMNQIAPGTISQETIDYQIKTVRGEIPYPAPR